RSDDPSSSRSPPRRHTRRHTAAARPFTRTASSRRSSPAAAPAHGSQWVGPVSECPYDRTGVQIMAYVVCEPCRDCKYTDCVVVCPCDCFYQDENMLYIDPGACIDCESCVPECHVE